MKKGNKLPSTAPVEKQLPITERIKSMADVYAYLKKTPEEALPYAPYTQEPHEKWHNAIEELALLAFALNEGVVLGQGQQRWLPIFIWSGAGLVFSHSGYDDDGADTGSASRLAFLSEELSDHAAKINPEAYKIFITTK